MAAEQPLSAPAAVRSLSLDRGPHRSFLSDVVIEHGPRDVLGRLFLTADTHLREMGVRLSFGTLDELVAVNTANRTSWSPLLPLFDPSLNDLDDGNGFALMARDASGEVVMTVASRLYELGNTTLAETIESLRVFYKAPEKSAWPGEEMRVTSKVAQSARNRVVFGGAAWVHPRFRGVNLVDPASPILRGVSLTRWHPELTFSFMVPELVRNGSAKRWHWNPDWGVTMINTPVKRNGVIDAALTWTNPELTRVQIDQYLGSRLTPGDAKIDGGIVERAANQKAAVGVR